MAIFPSASVREASILERAKTGSGPGPPHIPECRGWRIARTVTSRATKPRREVVKVGTPEEVYYRPQDRWTAQFVGEVNLVQGVADAVGIATELGFFDLAAPAGPGIARVAIRPEQLELRPDEQGNAEITDREFRGHDVLYRLRHETGGTVLIQRPSVELYAVGTRVFVRPGRGAVAPLRD